MASGERRLAGTMAFSLLAVAGPSLAIVAVAIQVPWGRGREERYSGGSGMAARGLMLSGTYSISNPDEPLQFDNFDISCVGDIVGTPVSRW